MATKTVAEGSDKRESARKPRPPATKKKTRDESASIRQRKLKAWREDGGLAELRKKAAEKAEAKNPHFRYAWELFVKSMEGPADPTTRHVLLTLSDHFHSGKVEAYPSVALLCEESSRSNGSVEAHLKRGEEGGWIVKVRRHKKVGPWVWRLALPEPLHALLPEVFKAQIRPTRSPKIGEPVPQRLGRGSPKIGEERFASSLREESAEAPRATGSPGGSCRPQTPASLASLGVMVPLADVQAHTPTSDEVGQRGPGGLLSPPATSSGPARAESPDAGPLVVEQAERRASVPDASRAVQGAHVRSGLRGKEAPATTSRDHPPAGAPKPKRLTPARAAYDAAACFAGRPADSSTARLARPGEQTGRSPAEAMSDDLPELWPKFHREAIEETADELELPFDQVARGIVSMAEEAQAFIKKRRGGRGNRFDVAHERYRQRVEANREEATA
ncbi:MAG: hypothetical protein M9894_17195 [Planctomycetes bacterium]|nr:hypothetical protein [Planctomycetota bacterium]